MVEHILGKDEVVSSNLIDSSSEERLVAIITPAVKCEGDFLFKPLKGMGKKSYLYGTGLHVNTDRPVFVYCIGMKTVSLTGQNAVRAAIAKRRLTNCKA